MRIRITSDEAFDAYLGLGPGRSLVALGHTVAKRAPKAPALNTLKNWSAKHSWVARAREHDSQIAERTRAHILQHEVHKRVALADAFSNLAQQAVDTTLKALKKQGTNLVAKAGDVEILVRAAAEAANKAEVLSGGVSDRQETRGTFAVPSELQALIDSSLTAEERSRIGKPELVS